MTPYDVRYVMTPVGPLCIRTSAPLSAARVRRIAAQEGYAIERFGLRLTDTIGVQTHYLSVEVA